MRAVLMLFTLILGACEAEKERTSGDAMGPCANVWTNDSLVPLGSSVTATCEIRAGCPFNGQTGQIQWHLGHRLLLESSVWTEAGSNVSVVKIQSFNYTRGFLTCSLRASTTLILGGVEIRAGYPPSAPQNLSCQTNLTDPNKLTCRWDEGQETHLPTQYYLHTQIRDSNENSTYKLPLGVQSYIIPRSGFVLFSEIQVYVIGVNELGEARSDCIFLEPVSAAKFDQPTILMIHSMPKRYGCLRLSWALSTHQAWMRDFSLTLEVRMKPADGSNWIPTPMLVSKARPKKKVDQCQLKHATQYFAQIRVRYELSPWSEWSSSQSGVTLESAPTGHIDSWMRVSGDHMRKQLNIHLFWKPSKQFRANGRNVSYIVSRQKAVSKRGRLCFTKERLCAFKLPGTRKVYLTAVNAAGKSSPIEVQLYQPKAPVVIENVKASSHDDSSILVHWESKELYTLTGFVLEWRPLLEDDLSFIRFETAGRNTSSLIIKGGVEPYKPYGIAVYPRFKNGIGLPQIVNAYSRQKAPSAVPNMKVKRRWEAHVELTWDELPIEQQNGVINSYQVFYWDKQGSIFSVNTDASERRVVLRGLTSGSLYEAFLMVSTQGGSLNGSTIHFQIEPFDAVTKVIIAYMCGLGLALAVIFTVSTCLSNQKRLKVGLWPVVPDPANSSIKKLTSGSIENMQSFKDVPEPNPVYFSHLSLMEVPMKSEHKDDDAWLNTAEATSDLGESICGSPCLLNSDSVTYATVVFSCQGTDAPQAPRPHVYLRSESTRPLLASEESGSPTSFQNLDSDGVEGEPCFFGSNAESGSEGDREDLWKDFPLLQALALNESENP